MDRGYTCPVCGFDGLSEPAYNADGGSYEICYSCGFEYGFTDDDLGFDHHTWRTQWIRLGMIWNSNGMQPQPPNWNPRRQLENVLRDERS